MARYGLTGLVTRLNTSTFPWGTIVVNLVGCFVAGFVWTILESRWHVNQEARAYVMVGFIGAFTTFSTLILESVELMRAAEWISAASNIALQNGVGIAALVAGVMLGRFI